MAKTIEEKFYEAYNIKKVTCSTCKHYTKCSGLKSECDFYNYGTDEVGFPPLTEWRLLRLICLNNGYWASTDELILCKKFDTLEKETMKKLIKCADKEYFYKGVRKILGVEDE